MTDQGSSSQSNSTQPVFSSSHKPVSEQAARNRSGRVRVRAGSKNGRPVRVCTGAEVAVGRAETGPSNGFVAAHEHDRARAHVLLLADHQVDAIRGVEPECLVGVLKQVGPAWRRARGHRRRQVEQPARIQREPAHHLQCTGGIFLADAHPALVACLDDAFAEDVGDVEEIWFPGRGDDERLRRLVPHPLGGDGDSSLSG